MFCYLFFAHSHLRAFRKIRSWWNIINLTDAPVSPKENLYGLEIQALSIFLWIHVDSGYCQKQKIDKGRGTTLYNPL